MPKKTDTHTLTVGNLKLKCAAKAERDNDTHHL